MQDYKDFTEYILINHKGVPIVEIGIGSDFRVFEELKKNGTDVRAIDIGPTTSDVIKDDVLNPDMEIYDGAGLIYSIRPPQELIPYIEEVARGAGADLIIRPLMTDDTPKNGKLINYKSAIFYKINRME
jgi:uncharacterized UPF0146 family protein